MTRRPAKELVLGFYPFNKGFGYALFESPLSPIDWGITRVDWREKKAPGLSLARALIERTRPNVIVMQERTDKYSHRAKRALSLQDLTQKAAEANEIRVYAFDREAIRYCFSGATSRYQIAQAIASQVEAFNLLLPPPRKPWESDPILMGVFQAASLVMTYYCQRGTREPSDVRSAKGHSST